MMKELRLNFILLAMAFLVAGCSGKIPKSLQQTKCEQLDSLMASGVLSDYFRHYKDERGHYPENLESFRAFLIDEGSGYDSGSHEMFEIVIIDPYTQKDLAYHPIEQKGEIVEYLLYSLGPDKKDDNLQKIKDYNAGLANDIPFTAYFFECEEHPKISPKQKADILLRLGRLYNSVLKVEVLEKE